MKAINHECYVSLEVSKLLKQVGFDWDTYSAYNKDGVFTDKNRSITTWNDFADYYSAPTIEVAQRWLREIRYRNIEVKSFVDGTVENRGKWWIWHVYNFNPPIDWVLLMGSDRRYSTYEEAQEAGIKKALEIILKKK